MCANNVAFVRVPLPPQQPAAHRGAAAAPRLIPRRMFGVLPQKCYICSLIHRLRRVATAAAIIQTQP